MFSCVCVFLFAHAFLPVTRTAHEVVLLIIKTLRQIFNKLIFLNKVVRKIVKSFIVRPPLTINNLK